MQTHTGRTYADDVMRAHLLLPLYVGGSGTDQYQNKRNHVPIVSSFERFNYRLNITINKLPLTLYMYFSALVRLTWTDLDTLEVSTVFSLKYFGELVPVSIQLEEGPQ